MGNTQWRLSLWKVWKNLSLTTAKKTPSHGLSTFDSWMVDQPDKHQPSQRLLIDKTPQKKSKSKTNEKKERERQRERDRHTDRETETDREFKEIAIYNYDTQWPHNPSTPKNCPPPLQPPHSTPEQPLDLCVADYVWLIDWLLLYSAFQCLSAESIIVL